MRITLFGLCASLCLAGGAAAAQPIPGADDPALREAALDWLTGENPREDLWRLGEIAADGNVAARVMVNSIYYSHIPSDFPDLNRQERRALLPPDKSGADRGFIPYPVARDAAPALDAYVLMNEAETAEEWSALAEQLIDARLYRQFADNVRFTLLKRQPDYAVEIAKYIEDNVAMDTEVQTVIWSFRFFENSLLGMVLSHGDEPPPEVVEQRRALWGGGPWRQEDAQSFDAALRDGRWNAIYVLRLFWRLQPDVTSRLEYAAQYEWVIDILEKVRPSNDTEGSAPTGAELERLGQLLTTDAAQTAYLQPLVMNCERYCPDMSDECVALGTLAPVVIRRAYATLDPVVTEAEYHRSNRAIADLMRYVQLIAAREVELPSVVTLPQCLVEASAAFAN